MEFKYYLSREYIEPRFDEKNNWIEYWLTERGLLEIFTLIGKLQIWNINFSSLEY